MWSFAGILLLFGSHIGDVESEVKVAVVHSTKFGLHPKISAPGLSPTRIGCTP
jgi:hypothetical protein